MSNTYQYILHPRLEPRTPFTGGRITDTDVLTLSDAASMATQHAKQTVTVGDFLRAAGRGEIALRAIVHRTAKVQKYDGGVYCNGGTKNENIVPAGAIPTLPLSACQALSNTGRAAWRTFDSFEVVDGELMRYTKGRLLDDELDFDTVPDDCRVTGNHVHALADAFKSIDEADTQPQAAPVEAESDKARVPQSFQPLQANTQPVSALRSGAVGWGRAVDSTQNKTPSQPVSRARAPFGYGDVPSDSNASLVSPYEVALLTHESAHRWLSTAGWTVEEAAYLLWAIEPTRYKKFVSLSPDSIGEPEAFYEVVDMLDRARQMGILRFPATPAAVIGWAQDIGLRLPQPLLDYSASLDKAAPVIAAPVVAVGPSGGVEPDKAGPLPLTTGDIAFCFAGLRCKTEKEWKILIGKGRGWIERCLVQPGTRGRGGAPKLWNPVFIGAALVRDGYAKPNNIRAKFQTIHLLQPWCDAWKTYEADNFDAE